MSHTKARRHKGVFYFPFFVPLCLCVSFSMVSFRVGVIPVNNGIDQGFADGFQGNFISIILFHMGFIIFERMILAAGRSWVHPSGSKSGPDLISQVFPPCDHVENAAGKFHHSDGMLESPMRGGNPNTQGMTANSYHSRCFSPVLFPPMEIDA